MKIEDFILKIESATIQKVFEVEFWKNLRRFEDLIVSSSTRYLHGGVLSTVLRFFLTGPSKLQSYKDLCLHSALCKKLQDPQKLQKKN